MAGKFSNFLIKAGLVVGAAAVSVKLTLYRVAATWANGV
jgi:hypothetical protein